jgi:uncharacterized protein (TIGR03118 family)
MRHAHFTVVALSGLGMIVGLSSAALGAGFNSYAPTILTSDVQGLGLHTDPNLKNPWGLSYSATSPFWNTDETTGLSTLYNASGVAQGLVVTIPGGSPTGTVQNPTTDFKLTNGNGNQASFLFDTLNGTVVGWNGPSGAVTQQTVSGAFFTGLALANNGTQNQLYAADNNAVTGSSSRPLIDVFGPNFANLSSTTAFVDPNLPAGLHPYNIQAVTINGVVTLVVTYRGAGGVGAVDYFDVNGNPMGHFTTDSHLLNPWGVALAPTAFGQFGGDLLVGNVANGQINAYDPSTLNYLGTLLDPNGQVISFPGLWALGFRQAGSTFNPNALYFNAGFNAIPGGAGNLYSDGLFGDITAVPEPPSAILLGLGLLVLLGVCRWATFAFHAPQ